MIQRVLASKGVVAYVLTCATGLTLYFRWPFPADDLMLHLIELREQQGLRLSFLIQVDTLAHKIPNFIEKAARAGCRYAFIGLESINPDNLTYMNPIISPT